MPTYNLDGVVPEDFEYEFKGETYVIPGDVTIEDALALANLFTAAAQAELAGDNEATLSTNTRIAEKLLELFRQRRPDLEALPFGVTGYRFVLGTLLTSLGLLIEDEDDPDEPATPTEPSPGKKPPRPRRSRGSRR